MPKTKMRTYKSAQSEALRLNRAFRKRQKRTSFLSRLFGGGKSSRRHGI